MAGVRGGRFALVYQDPMSSLNPVHTIGRQIVEAIRAHEDVSQRVARGAGGRAARRGRPARSRRGASTTTRTSSPAACGSG